MIIKIIVTGFLRVLLSDGPAVPGHGAAEAGQGRGGGGGAPQAEGGAGGGAGGGAAAPRHHRVSTVVKSSFRCSDCSDRI